eukprot:CAMPEP_0203748310 /NCGR_PEP_ID=MMETSP0098-20131031/3233_1 /ASSEMBLY_ACC=CAM_ASM_000208 /TAXON_ID=96639 /ORGANISM=" , Strain NY0313808BC1" /LENGTH=669 /DNA_ID=CAMNT_0050637021 /DNA_START=835 /DNA_END=2845 /DNA_ORIENTATION=-
MECDAKRWSLERAFAVDNEMDKEYTGKTSVSRLIQRFREVEPTSRQDRGNVRELFWWLSDTDKRERVDRGVGEATVEVQCEQSTQTKLVEGKQSTGNIVAEVALSEDVGGLTVEKECEHSTRTQQVHEQQGTENALAQLPYVLLAPGDIDCASKSSVTLDGGVQIEGSNESASASHSKVENSPVYGPVHSKVKRKWIRVMWDVENVQIPKSKCAFSVAQEISKSLIDLGKALWPGQQDNIQCRIFCFHNPAHRTLSMVQRKELVSAFVTLIDIGKSKADKQDFSAEDLLIGLISSDTDFIPTIQRYSRIGYRFANIYRPVHEFSLAQNMYETYAWVCLDWETCIINKSADRKKTDSRGVAGESKAKQPAKTDSGAGAEPSTKSGGELGLNESAMKQTNQVENEEREQTRPKSGRKSHLNKNQRKSRQEQSGSEKGGPKSAEEKAPFAQTILKEGPTEAMDPQIRTHSEELISQSDEVDSVVKGGGVIADPLLVSGGGDTIADTTLDQTQAVNRKQKRRKKKPTKPKKQGEARDNPIQEATSDKKDVQTNDTGVNTTMTDIEQEVSILREQLVARLGTVKCKRANRRSLWIPDMEQIRRENKTNSDISRLQSAVQNELQELRRLRLESTPRETKQVPTQDRFLAGEAHIQHELNVLKQDALRTIGNLNYL